MNTDPSTTIRKKPHFNYAEDPHNIDKHLAFLGWELKYAEDKVSEKEQ